MAEKLKKYLTFISESIISTKIEIPNDIKEISKVFNNANKSLYVVGGAVRDFLQKKVPHDFDLVTDALPEESKKILKGWNVSDEQGKNFGVLRIYTEDEPLGHELATFRKDISGGRDTKGDEDKVEIGNHITIEDDVKRRDLTINALFYDINKKEIVDLVGGIEDIKNNIIRSVGDPAERFKEDRLRILRVFRFAARTKGDNGGNISTDTSNAIKNDNRLRGVGFKDDVSQERIHEEWKKVIEHAEKGGNKIMEIYIKLLNDYNMWEQMFPKMEIDFVDYIPILNSSIIFSELFYTNDIPKMKKYMVRDLKFSGDIVNDIEFLTELGKKFGVDDHKYVYSLAKLKNRFSIDNNLIRDYYGKDIDSFIKYCDDGFIVNGNDLAAEGFKGIEIEREKQRREIERFKNDY